MKLLGEYMHDTFLLAIVAAGAALIVMAVLARLVAIALHNRKIGATNKGLAQRGPGGPISQVGRLGLTSARVIAYYALIILSALIVGAASVGWLVRGAATLAVRGAIFSCLTLTSIFAAVCAGALYAAALKWKYARKAARQIGLNLRYSISDRIDLWFGPFRFFYSSRCC